MSVRHRVALCASLFLSVAAFGFLEPFVPLYLELSGLTRGQIGLVTGIGTGMALVIQPLLGRLSDRLDARRPLMFGAAVAAGIAYLLYRQANGVIPFVVLTAVGINGVLYLNTAAAVLVGRMISRQGNGPQGGAGAFASFRVWGSLGYVVISLLVGWLLGRQMAAGAAMSRAAIAPVFLYGPVLFALVAGVILFLPDPKRAGPTAEAGEPVDQAVQEDPPEQQQTCARNLTRFLRAQFLFVFAYCGASAYLSLYLKGWGRRRSGSPPCSPRGCCARPSS
jgi:PPP family 3-phenylpropionic acid transporter